MSENKKAPEESSKKPKITIKNKSATAIKPSNKATALAPYSSRDLWREFDNTFDRFRSDFEDLLFPSVWPSISFVPSVRIPVVDLAENEKEYVVTAEMPGFKKEDIEIEVTDNSMAISGYAGWKYDEKGKLYICKERACETFYREINLIEEIKSDDVTANLADGVLEVTLPKKAPKKKKKVEIK